ncbi:MAG: putative sulfate/molybdate transporter [Syntrophomonadaceae bacterium]|nr:putative sulfate/molybdate transporter [Syntrophomonadaceae bacterium]
MNRKRPENFISELSGSIGDLGTFLPYIIGAITIGGLDTTGVLFTFGIMYIVTGWYYRIPIPVQPMKVMGAAILVHHLSAGEVAAAGILMGVTLLFLAMSGLVEKLAQLTPQSVTAGIQVGLGISLAMLGIKFIQDDLILGLIIVIGMFFLFSFKKLPVAIIAVVGGTLLAFLLHPELSFPRLAAGFHLPHLTFPEWKDFGRGFTLAYLPQLPLTLTNAVLVTVALAHNLFPNESSRVNEKNLCISLGLGNLIAMPLGGFPMCHGSGGLAAHYRFGARTGLSVIIIGVFLLLTAVILGPSGVDLLGVIPRAVLGGLLFFSGIDLIKSGQYTGKGKSLYPFIITVVLSVAVNPAVGFVAGIALVYLLNKRWVKI